MCNSQRYNGSCLETEVIMLESLPKKKKRIFILQSDEVMNRTCPAGVMQRLLAAYVSSANISPPGPNFTTYPGTSGCIMGNTSKLQQQRGTINLKYRKYI